MFATKKGRANTAALPCIKPPYSNGEKDIYP